MGGAYEIGIVDPVYPVNVRILGDLATLSLVKIEFIFLLRIL